MTPHHARVREERAERCYRCLLHVYPREFRHRFAPDLLDLSRDLYRRHALYASAFSRARFWWRMIRDACHHGFLERANASRQGRRLPLGVHYAKGSSPMSLVFEDLRHAVRALRTRPALTAVIVLTLALGVFGTCCGADGIPA